MDDEWGTAASNSTQPTFSLFNRVSPEEAAQRDTFIDIIVYNRWSKAERRLYQRLKAEIIAKRIEQEQLTSLDDITNSLTQLTLIKTNSGQKSDPQLDDLIDTLENMKLKHNGTEDER